MANLARHAFGKTENLQNALSSGTIDAYDILFLDGDTEPKIGWITKDGEAVIVESKDNVAVVEALPESGEEGVIYIFNDEGYVWTGTEFVTISKSTDLSALEAEIATKITASEVDVKISQATVDDTKYVISHKPDGTIVDYREKEIRVMCPSDTDWQLQQSGEGADANSYYIGFKAYAPEGVVSFKEDTAKTISDTTMYYFENNEFAGTEANGRKYSIVWLPVAVFNEATGVWTYHGSKSSTEKYVGWYYSVEWYDADGEIVSSDCIRINLSNEECHTYIKPFYIQEAITSANTYTDEQLANMSNVIEVIEF